MAESPTVPEKTEKRAAEPGIEQIARTYKFYVQQSNPRVVHKLHYSQIATSSFVSRHRRTLSRLSAIFGKYGIDCDKYIRFCVTEAGARSINDIATVESIRRYANELKSREQMKKIFDYYMKSANYVADRCIELGVTPVEFLKGLIAENRLAYEYLCGNLSKYFIATIRNFRTIYRKLDRMNRDELRIIFDGAEELGRMVQDVFLKYKSRRVSPLSLANAIIKQKTSK